MTFYQQQMLNMKKIEVEPGLEVGYEEFGSGDKYIFSMHMGYGEDSYVRRFADNGYHVFMMWNRGSGPSTVPTEDYGNDWFNKFADDVIALADKLGIDKFIYTGGSHGSGTGWHLIWKHPERIKAFIALVCGPHPVGADVRSYKNSHHGPDADTTVLCADDAAVLKRRARFDVYNIDRAANQLKADYRRPFCELGSEENLQNVLRTLQTPTLLIGGIKDNIIPPDLMFRTAKCLPNCKLVMYSGIGHRGPSYEITEETLFESLHFLNCIEENEGRVYAKVVED